MEIQEKIKALYGRGISIVDLTQRFGALLVKSEILRAQEFIGQQEEKSGELVLTDLVSEDQILEDRLLQTKQTGIAIGAFPKKITTEELKKSKRLP